MKRNVVVSASNSEAHVVVSIRVNLKHLVRCEVDGVVNRLAEKVQDAISDAPFLRFYRSDVKVKM